jgi:hypothetical protein
MKLGPPGVDLPVFDGRSLCAFDFIGELEPFLRQMEIAFLHRLRAFWAN